MRALKSQSVTRLDIRARQSASRADGEAAEGLILKKKVVVAEGGGVVRSKKESGFARRGSRAKQQKLAANRAGMIVASTAALNV